MRKLTIKFLINVLVFIVVNYLYDGEIFINKPSIVFAAFLLLILNMLFKPILHIIALPITIITLGIFSFIINAFVIKIMDWFMGSVNFANFWQCILVSLLITICNYSIKDYKYKEYKYKG